MGSDGGMGLTSRCFLCEAETEVSELSLEHVRTSAWIGPTMDGAELIWVGVMLCGRCVAARYGYIWQGDV